MKGNFRSNLLILLFVICNSAVFGQSVNIMKDVEISEYKSNSPASNYIVYLSGDGGMNTFSVNLCKQFQAKGYSVIAINSKKYFWSAKEPKDLGAIITKIINQYNKEWGEKPFTIVGYSFGADAVAFIPANVSDKIQGAIKSLILLQPSSSTDFEIKLAELYGSSDHEDRKYSILRELNQMKSPAVLCLFSVEEKGLLKTKLQNKHIAVEVLPGDHRFNYNYPLLINRITEFIAKL